MDQDKPAWLPPEHGQGGRIYLAGDPEQELISLFTMPSLTELSSEASAALYDGAVWGMASAARLDFSDLNAPGGYYIIMMAHTVGDIPD